MDDLCTSRTLVEQRIRNRRIEAIELAANWPGQIEYQKRMPDISVPNEVINQWYDVWPEANSETLPEPLYSTKEISALRNYATVMESVCSETPLELPPLDETQSLPAWEKLRKAAQEALETMERRGMFSEDVLEKDL